MSAKSKLREAATGALMAWQSATYGTERQHKAMVLAMTELGKALAQPSPPSEQADRAGLLKTFLAEAEKAGVTHLSIDTMADSSEQVGRAGLVDLLRELEWCVGRFNSHGDSESYCPSCGGFEGGGHIERCKLRAAIDALAAQPATAHISADELLEDWTQAAGTCFVNRDNGEKVTYGSIRRNDLVQLIAAARQQPATAPAQEPPLHIGACIVDGKLHATVMRNDGGGHITVLAVAEMEVASLVDHDCVAQMKQAGAPLLPGMTKSHFAYALYCARLVDAANKQRDEAYQALERLSKQQAGAVVSEPSIAEFVERIKPAWHVHLGVLGQSRSQAEETINEIVQSALSQGGGK